MRYDTQQSIYQAQQAILECRNEDILPTRGAIAQLSGKSISWITKLVQRWTEYIADDGSGNIIIVQAIQPPNKVIRQSAETVVQHRTVDNTLILTRITEVLETLTGMLTTGIVSNAGGVVNGREITKNSANSRRGPTLIPAELRTKLIPKGFDWNPIKTFRENLKLDDVQLYLLHEHLAYYLLKDHNDELIQAVQDALDGKSSSKSNGAVESKPTRQPIGHVFQLKNGSGTLWWHMITGYTDYPERPYLTDLVENLLKRPDKLTLLGELAVQNATRIGEEINRANS